MNRITLRILFVLLAAGLVVNVASCRNSASESAAVTAQTAAPETQAAEAFAAETEASAAVVTEPAETKPREERFVLTFAGDCTLGCNPVNYYAGEGFIKTVGEDYRYPFRNVISYFENDDFTLVNLEGPLCDSGNPVQKTHTFRGPTEYVNILTQNSVEAVTIANNHTYDYGQQGYDDTVAALNAAGIPYVQRDDTTVVTLEGGLTVGIYGAVYYLLDVEDMVAEITAMREQGVDLIIFAPHWGTEGTYRPTEQQTEVGHAAIDAGADIVYGTHPHVLQPIEKYGDGVIFYSLGNFSFGGNGYPRDFDTVLVQQEVIREESGSVVLGELTLVPASVSSVEGRNNYQPTPYEAGSAGYDRVLEKLDGTWQGSNLKIG